MRRSSVVCGSARSRILVLRILLRWLQRPRVEEKKATPEELDAYRKFTLAVAEHVAEAHKEQGEAVSSGEREAADGRGLLAETDR
jgi:hypothetical protein